MRDNRMSGISILTFSGYCEKKKLVSVFAGSLSVYRRNCLFHKKMVERHDNWLQTVKCGRTDFSPRSM